MSGSTKQRGKSTRASRSQRKRTVRSDLSDRFDPVLERPQNPVAAYVPMSDLQSLPGDGALQRNEPRVENCMADPASWKRVLDDASNVDLWDGVKRHERPGWRDWLDAADRLASQPRTPLPQVSITTIVIATLCYVA